MNPDPESNLIPSRESEQQNLVENEINLERKTGGCLHGLFGIVNVMVGGGCLVLPWAIMQSGLVIGIIMVIFTAICSLYSQRLQSAACVRYFGRRIYFMSHTSVSILFSLSLTNLIIKNSYSQIIETIL
jgi:amino acid permease